ncbi:MAG: asparagine synthetase A [Candidatus Kariarchaeaceae archaeon]|jgi:asparaginyl-tRNA synthetase
MLLSLETTLEHKEIKKIKAVMKIQSIALKAIHDYFDKIGFMQLMPVILSKFTDPLGPDPGSSVIKTGEIEYGDQKLQLTQSMILQKQVAIGAGLSKFYIVSPNVRLEAAWRKESGRHLFEFSQVDFEIHEAKMVDVFKLVEGLLRFVQTEIILKAPEELEFLDRKFTKWDETFPKYTTHELEKKYGKDWEHLASLDADTPFFAVCHDREFYDKADRTREGRHFLNYDLIYPEGFGEALSGGERESEYDYILERLKEDKLSLDYEDFLDRAKAGKIRPRAGAGIGVERLVRYLTGAEHIGDIQLFRRIPGEKVVI